MYKRQAYPCEIQPGTVLERAYQRRSVGERHRHRYEFNNSYRQQLEEAGLVISGTSPDGRLVEAVELPGHDFYVGVQYHPCLLYTSLGTFPGLIKTAPS